MCVGVGVGVWKSGVYIIPHVTAINKFHNIHVSDSEKRGKTYRWSLIPSTSV